MISARALEAVTADELAKAAHLFSEMKALRMKLTDIKEEVLDNAFESHVHLVLEKLEERLPSLENETMKVSEVTMAKHGLYDASFLQAITLCQAVSPALGDSVKELRLANFSFLMLMQEAIQKSGESELGHQREVERLQEVVNDLESRFGSLEIECEDGQRRAKMLEDRVQELEAEAASTADMHEQAMTALKAEKGRPKMVFGHPVVGKPDNSNTASSPSPSSSSSPNSKSLPISSRESSNSNRAEKGAHRAGPSSPSSKTSQKDGGPIHPLTSAQKLSIFRADIQKAIDEQRCRYITLNETCELIEKLYESKLICNEKARSGLGGIPIETMEQHLYRQMEKKYGLRSLAIEHAGNFIFALQRFQFESNEVSTFYKIFCNVVEEEFQLTMKELKRSIRDLLMVQVMTRHPTKDQNVLTNLLDNKMNSFISEDEWADMMNYLYNETDSATICLILKKLARDEMEKEELRRSDNKSPLSQVMKNVADGNSDQASRQAGGASAVASKPSSRVGFAASVNKAFSSSEKSNSNAFSANNANLFKLRFTTFLKAVQDFQLKSHEEYLEQFRSAFHRLDDNADGILDTALFYQCFSSVYSQMFKGNATNSSGGNPRSSNGNDGSLNVFNKLTINTNSNNNNNNNSDKESDQEEMMELFSLVVQTIDPLERDVIIYSEAVVSLTKFGGK